MSNDWLQKNHDYTFTTWRAQNTWNPISMKRGEGIYFWDKDDNRYFDLSSQLFNVNIGHGNQHVVEAIQKQAATMPYAFPAIATEMKGLLGEKLSKVTPHDLTKTFFTLGGSDGIENALKIARLFTGKQKVLARYRAYHGATFAAMSVGGDPRRLANEPGVPWAVHVHDPYSYRSPLYAGRTQAEGDQALIDQMEETILYEGPDKIAAMVLEGYSGTSGIIQGGETYWHGIAYLCEKYNILLIVDEVMSGFGRVGKWFGINHYPWVKPDIMVMAKGLTSGYAPLGAVTVTSEIAAHFDDHPLVAGLTYGGHALCLAAGLATIEVYENDNLMEHSAKMGTFIENELNALQEEHACLGEVRGAGVHWVLELVKNKDTREPMGPFNQPFTEPMAKVAAALRERGISTFAKWNWIFYCPPLIITEAEVQETLAIINDVLSIADEYCV